uniref:Uncharacterized protein n=1 Tax=Sphaerodactylus townsendi TaxID=933632 RepID=A0ACB8GBI8_9SAUR
MEKDLFHAGVCAGIVQPRWTAPVKSSGGGGAFLATQPGERPLLHWGSRLHFLATQDSASKILQQERSLPGRVAGRDTSPPLGIAAALSSHVRQRRQDPPVEEGPSQPHGQERNLSPTGDSSGWCRQDPLVREGPSQLRSQERDLSPPGDCTDIVRLCRMAPVRSFGGGHFFPAMQWVLGPSRTAGKVPHWSILLPLSGMAKQRQHDPQQMRGLSPSHVDGLKLEEKSSSGPATVSTVARYLGMDSDGKHKAQLYGA